MMLKIIRILFIVAILSFLSFSGYPEQIFAIKAGHLIDGKSDTFQKEVIVVIKGNKIVAVGKNIDIPKDATILDLSDKTVLPGFIDAHTHIMSDGGDDYGDDLYKNSTPFRAIRAVASVRKALSHGFTALRDVESEGTMYTVGSIR